MIKCAHCSREISEFNTERVLLNCDGDFVCNKACYDAYHKEMDHFCSITLKDDKKFAAWLGVPEEWVRSD